MDTEVILSAEKKNVQGGGGGKSGLPKIEGGKPCIETVLRCVT